MKLIDLLMSMHQEAIVRIEDAKTHEVYFHCQFEELTLCHIEPFHDRIVDVIAPEVYDDDEFYNLPGITIFLKPRKE